MVHQAVPEVKVMHPQEETLQFSRPEDMACWAALCWQRLQTWSHGLVTCSGPIGAGKTTLLQQILREGGYPHRVTSPTYALWHTYEWDDVQGRHQIWHHVDAYRLTAFEELDELGWSDALAHGVGWLEWPECVQPLPKISPQLTITLDYAQPGRCLTARWEAAESC